MIVPIDQHIFQPDFSMEDLSLVQMFDGVDHTYQDFPDYFTK